MIKIDFQYDTKHGKYQDALYLPDDHTYTDAEIESMKQERVNNWINIVENPPQPEPDIIEIDGIKYEKVDLNGQIVLKPV